MLFLMASRWPWWLSLVLVIVSYLVFHLWHIHLAASVHAARHVSTPHGTPSAMITHAVNQGIGNGIVMVLFIFTAFLQYVVPVVFAIAALTSFVRGRKARVHDY